MAPVMTMGSADTDRQPLIIKSAVKKKVREKNAGMLGMLVKIHYDEERIK
jgi:hypothetical protein